MRSPGQMTTPAFLEGEPGTLPGLLGEGGVLRASLGVEVRRQREERCISIIGFGRDRHVNGRSQLGETLPDVMRDFKGSVPRWDRADQEKRGRHQGTPLFSIRTAALQKSRGCRTGCVLRRDQHGVDDVDDTIGALNIGLGHGRVVDSHRCLGVNLDV